MKPRPSFRDIIWYALRVVNLCLLFAIAGSAGLLLGTYSALAKVIPRARDLGDIRPGQACRVLSAEGELLGTVAAENREFVPLERIPERLQEATVAVEDKDFYRHIGVDPRGILRAAVHDVIALGPRQGGSTITQQLARNVYLTRSKTLTRKLAEVILAVQLERAYTKPEILELYLNQIYFGEGAYGVEVAAKTYFGKRVSQLTAAECALLAGLPKRPEYYSPFENSQRAVDRRNLVLAMMAEQNYLSEEELEEAQEEPLKLTKNRKPLGLSPYQAPYFTNYVLREVATRYGPDALYKGGLTIHTTLNLEMQKAAEDAIRWGMERGRSANVGKMALVAVDVRTGAIKAMVGGPDWKKSQYNSAVQGGRPAGSAFKPFVYAAALEQGYTPEDIVVDAPVSYPGAGGKPWRPQNYSRGKFYGPVTFRRALAHSYNVSAVKVADRIGVGSVIATAERMGIYHPMQPVLPLAIGYCDVSPLEIASAYAVFAARGMRTEPYGIRKIVDPRGRSLYEHKVQAWRALDQQVATEMVDMLSDVIKYGTAARIRSQLDFPAAGKTGTSSDHRDAWFIGFTSDVSAAVWAGNDSFSPTRRVAGSTIPAPAWARFMREAQPIMSAAAPKDRESVVEISSEELGAPEAPKQLDSPEPREQRGPASESAPGSERFVTKDICPMSGLIHRAGCPDPVQVTYDLQSGDKPPTRMCDEHGGGEPEEATPPTRRPPARASDVVTLPTCAITGKLATPFCPVVRNRTFQADEAPTETCTRHGRRPPSL